MRNSFEDIFSSFDNIDNDSEEEEDFEEDLFGSDKEDPTFYDLDESPEIPDLEE